jgi:hypothetical protein
MSTSEGTIAVRLKSPSPTGFTDTSEGRFPTAGSGGITLELAKNSDRSITVTLNGTSGGPFTFRRPIPPCDSRGLHVVIAWGSEVVLYLNGQEDDRQPVTKLDT